METTYYLQRDILHHTSNNMQLTIIRKRTVKHYLYSRGKRSSQRASDNKKRHTYTKMEGRIIIEFGNVNTYKINCKGVHSKGNQSPCK